MGDRRHRLRRRRSASGPGRPQERRSARRTRSAASYALRRGIAELDSDATFRPEIATLFPSRRAFTQALRDLKRYVTYSPRDPAGLTALGYVLYTVPGEERRCS